MIKLIEFQEQAIYRGYLIKFVDTSDDRNNTCLMVCEILGEKGFQLIRVDGYKAGICVRKFVEEGLEGCGLSVEWLIKNYRLWTYIDCGIENIYILSEPDINFFR